MSAEKETNFMSIYRGTEGMWAWLMHRITGVAVFLFLLVHIAETSLIGWGPEHYDAAIGIFHQPIFRIGEVFLGAAVLFHALNGVRIMIIDFVEAGTAVQKQLFYGVIAAFVAILAPGAYIILRPLFGG